MSPPLRQPFPGYAPNGCTAKAHYPGGGQRLCGRPGGHYPGSRIRWPDFSLIIGLAAGVLCYFALFLKHKLGYDDALDVVVFMVSAGPSGPGHRAVCQQGGQ